MGYSRRGTSVAALNATYAPLPPSATDGKLVKWNNTTKQFEDGSALAGGANGVQVVNHGSVASTARPSGAAQVFWTGSVAPTNGVPGDQWRDTTLNATRYNVGGVWFYPPGLELAYAEVTTTDTTTNTFRSAAASNLISGMSATAVGTGQPVDIEFVCPAVLHSVAADYVAADLVVNGVGASEDLAAMDSSSTSNGRTLILRRRKILTAGTSYTFQIGKYMQAAGTGTYAGAASNPMHLSLTCR